MLRTLQALENLEKLLACDICGCTLSYPMLLPCCEHTFCRPCISDRLGEPCPICSLPCKRRDVQLDRNLWNVIKICQHMKTLLNNGQPDDEDEENDASAAQDEVDGCGTKPVALNHCDTADSQKTIQNSDDDETVIGKDERIENSTKVPKNTRIESKETKESKLVRKSGKKRSKSPTKKLSALKPIENAENEAAKMEFPQPEVTGSDVISPALVRKTRRVTKEKNKRKKLLDMNHNWRIGQTDGEACGTCKKDKGQGRRVKVMSPVGSGPIRFALDSQPSSSQNSDFVEPKTAVREKGVAKEIASDTVAKEKDAVAKETSDVAMETGKVAESETSVEEVGDLQQHDENKEQTTAVLDEPIKESKKTENVENTDTDEEETKQTTPVQNLKSKTASPDEIEKSKDDKGNNSATPKRGRRNKRPASPSLQTPTSKRAQMTPKTPASAGRPRRAAISSPAVASPKIKRNAKGETPLHVACIKNNVAKVEELLKAGANPNIKDYAGWTPLHEAVNHGYMDVARLLLDHHALINIPGADNDSPLHDAVSNGRVDCIRLLVSRGADTNVRNSEGLTPRDLAVHPTLKEALETSVCQEASQRNVLVPVSRAESVVMLMTGLKAEQKAKVKECAEMMDAEIAGEFSEKVTHVITEVGESGTCARTLKFLNAVLTGKWILNMGWVVHCVKEEDMVDEEMFEVPGSHQNPESQAPRKGRLNVEKQLPGLFDGIQFYFSGTFSHPTPTKQQLQTLVRNGGGTVLLREPKLDPFDTSTPRVPYHAKIDSDVGKCSTFIVYESLNEENLVRDRFLCSVPAAWICDCAADFSLLPVPEVPDESQ